MLQAFHLRQNLKTGLLHGGSQLMPGGGQGVVSQGHTGAGAQGFQPAGSNLGHQLCGVALEAAAYGVTVNCIAPGPTQTGWIDEEFEKVVVPLIPMGKLIQPEDIAQTALFLAGQQAGMITGQVIKVSGGKAL